MTIDLAKLTGHTVMGPPADAVVVPKITGFAVLGMASNAIAVSKVVGYAVLYPVPSTGGGRPIVNCCS